MAGRLDDTPLTDEVFGRKVPWYVVRLLNGACCLPQGNGCVLLAHGNREFVLTGEQFDKVQEVAKRVAVECARPRGMTRPFSIEDVLQLESDADILWSQRNDNDPKHLRVCFLRSDSQGPGFYRSIQPTGALNTHTQTVRASTTEWLSVAFGQPYDIIVASRMNRADIVEMLMRLQAGGKQIVYETDDNLEAIPEWNPVKAYYTEEMYRAWRFMVEHADGVICSTEPLRQALGAPKKTTVCQNGIDPEMWPMKVHNAVNVSPLGPARVRVLWSGSHTHQADLSVVVSAIQRVLAKIPEVDFVWMGFAPTEFLAASIGGDGKARRCIDPQYRTRMTYVDGVPVTQYPAKVASLGGDIAIAPLVDCEFNKSKSALKVLEAWAMGIPIIASPVQPYADTVTHKVNGILANSTGEWFDAIRHLVRDAEERQRLAVNGLATLNERRIMPVIVEQYERALLKLARGKVTRPECAASIEARCKEKGW
ncbi:MAG: hypothetical protein A2W31_04995 [Planctomycetes bacterium RBG_16_64_10]|nr:MAG: hypothetical protein A2W31_04995 [Planctomycetes bacterium RBG_16_64_10]